MNCPSCGNWSDMGFCDYCGYSGCCPPPPAAPEPKLKALMVKEGANWYPVQKHQMTAAHPGYYDGHLEAWVPVPDRQAELAALLGAEYTFDTYYGAYFAKPGVNG